VIAAAFNSLSLDPPLLLWCVARQSLADLGLEVDRACGLSVLASGQEGLVHRSSADAETAWEHGEVLGAPLVAGAAAAFEVVVVRRVQHGDHVLFVGEVAGFSYVAGRTGLARYSGEVALPAPAGT
jgi:flavin reductase (DIM6/NTAB) family NADH-FMN oxidoreductase RutF